MMKIWNTTLQFREHRWRFLKAILIVIIIAYLVHAGRLDFAKITELYRRPTTTFLLMAIFFIGAMFVATFRWWLFVKHVNPSFPFLQLLRIVLQSTFLSLVVPGSGGLDMVKALLLFRQEKFVRKTSLAITVVMDRVTGVAALLTIAVGAAYFYPELSTNIQFRVIISSAYLMLGVLIISAFILLGPMRWPLQFITRILRRLPSKFPEKIINAIIEHREHKRLLVAAFCLSLTIQISMVLMFSIIFFMLEGKAIDFWLCFTLVPIGMLSTLLPIGPAGIGAGYLGFAYLFDLAGIGQGANAYNFFVLIQLLCSVLAGLSLIGSSRKRKYSEHITGQHYE